MGIAVALVLLGCALVVAYFVSLALPSREPYPFLAEYGSKKKKRATALQASDSSQPGGAVAGTAPTSPAAPAPSPEVPDAVVVAASSKHGEGLYNIYCVACHQAEGHGKVGFAPFIRNSDFLALASDRFLRTTITTGRTIAARTTRTARKITGGALRTRGTRPTISAVATLASSDAAECANPTVVPGTGDLVKILRLSSHDRLQPRSHDREQTFDSVNPVPEQIRMSFLQRAW